MGDQEALVREWEEIGQEDDPEIDALAVATAGVDQVLNKQDLTPVWCRDKATRVVQVVKGRLQPFQQV